jgi:hypothetical protein
MCSHIFSLHPSIWDVVDNGMQLLGSDDENYNTIVAQESIHNNAQAKEVR